MIRDWGNSVNLITVVMMLPIKRVDNLLKLFDAARL